MARQARMLALTVLLFSSTTPIKRSYHPGMAGSCYLLIVVISRLFLLRQDPRACDKQAMRVNKLRMKNILI